MLPPWSALRLDPVVLNVSTLPSSVSGTAVMVESGNGNAELIAMPPCALTRNWLGPVDVNGAAVEASAQTKVPLSPSGEGGAMPTQATPGAPEVLPGEPARIGRPPN